MIKIEQLLIIYLLFLIIPLACYYIKMSKISIKKKDAKVKTKGIIREIKNGMEHNYIYKVLPINSKKSIDSISYYMKYNSHVLKNGDEVDIEIYETKRGKVCKIISNNMVPIKEPSSSTIMIYPLVVTYTFGLIAYFYIFNYTADFPKKIGLSLLILFIIFGIVSVTRILVINNLIYKKGKLHTAKILKKEAKIPYDNSSSQKDTYYFEVELENGKVLNKTMAPTESSILQKLQVGDKVEILVYSKFFLFKDFADDFVNNYISKKKR